MHLLHIFLIDGSLLYLSPIRECNTFDAYLCEEEEIASGAYSKWYSNSCGQQTQQYTPKCVIVLTEGGQEATVAGTMYANRLIDQHQKLEKEYQEKNHKIETGVTAKRFVSWTVPVWMTSKPNLKWIYCLGKNDQFLCSNELCIIMYVPA